MDKFFNFLSKNNEKIEAFQYLFVALSFLITIYSANVPYLVSFLVGVAIFFLTLFTILGNETLNWFQNEVKELIKNEKLNNKKEIRRRNKIKENMNPVLLNMLISIFSITFIFQETYDISYWNFTYWLLFIYPAIMLFSVFSKKKIPSDKYVILCTIIFCITGGTLVINSFFGILFS